jgi:hypothetical protein
MECGLAGFQGVGLTRFGGELSEERVFMLYVSRNTRDNSGTTGRIATLAARMVKL